MSQAGNPLDALAGGFGGNYVQAAIDALNFAPTFTSTFDTSQFGGSGLSNQILGTGFNSFTPTSISTPTYNTGLNTLSLNNTLFSAPITPPTLNTNISTLSNFGSFQPTLANEIRFAKQQRVPSTTNTDYLRRIGTDAVARNQADDLYARQNAQSFIRHGTPIQAFNAQFALSANNLAEGIQGSAIPFLSSLSDAQTVGNSSATYTQRAIALGSIVLETATAGQAPSASTLTRSFDTHTFNSVLTSRRLTSQIDVVADSRVISQVDTVVSAPRTAVTRSVRELRDAGLKDAHHVIQDAAVRDLPGYNRLAAPGVQLPGPPTTRGTPHYTATQVQRQSGGGTYAAERRIGYKALRRAGYSPEDARRAIEEADNFFYGLGVQPDTPTRIPGNR